jgi:DNA-binding ferritin-like protein
MLLFHNAGVISARRLRADSIAAREIISGFPKTNSRIHHSASKFHAFSEVLERLLQPLKVINSSLLEQIQLWNGFKLTGSFFRRHSGSLDPLTWMVKRVLHGEDIILP